MSSPHLLQIETSGSTLSINNPAKNATAVATLDCHSGLGYIHESTNGLDLVFSLANYWSANPTLFPNHLPNFETARWQKYRHRRLYVKQRCAGQPDIEVGHLDLATGESHINNPSSTVPFLIACIKDLYPTPDALTQAANKPLSQPPTPAQLPQTKNRPPGADLAANKPGGDLKSISDSVGSHKSGLRRTIDRLTDAKTPERAWRKGAEGEIEVARRLAKLPELFQVLHSIPIGSGGRDIDHLIIGPPGIFCANTKNMSGNVWVGNRSVLVNGKPQDWLIKSRREAKDVRKRLGAVIPAETAACPVQPIIIVMAPRFAVKTQPDDVKIVARKEIARWLTSLPAVLSDEDVSHWYEAARQTATWTS